MFITLDFDTEETDDSHVLITEINSMGQPEETIRLDKTNYDVGNGIQVGHSNTGRKIRAQWEQMTFQTPFLFHETESEN